MQFLAIYLKNMEHLKLLEEKIGIKFHDNKLLYNALLHRSYLNENKKLKMESNEKLEFLGDSVLSLATSIYLYRRYTDLHEGEYTNIKAKIVRTESLHEAARELGLGEYVKLSKGEIVNNGRDNVSILADCFEAVIGAIFLDAGYNKASEFISKFLFKDQLDYIVANDLYQSPKNRLQEYFQNKYKKLPIYKLIGQTGPEHSKNYSIGVYFENKILGEGEGLSKKQAEEKAATCALQKLNI